MNKYKTFISVQQDSISLGRNDCSISALIQYILDLGTNVIKVVHSKSTLCWVISKGVFFMYM